MQRFKTLKLWYLISEQTRWIAKFKLTEFYRLPQLNPAEPADYFNVNS